MDYVIVDLEASCWRGGGRRADMETIEIGAVRLSGPEAEPGAEFSSFIRPVGDPVLSDFCRELTGIRQEDVDGAETFAVVFPRFLAWCNASPFTLCSWGGYDLGQLRQDCNRHRFRWPTELDAHVNLKLLFAERHGIKPCGMKGALGRVGLTLEGRHHRGIDDARNIATLARTLLPAIGASARADGGVG